MISTRNLAALPDIDALKRLLQSLAMLDAILMPEWEYRYYSFNAQWDDTEQMGSMRNGSGDDFHALFSPAGCFLKGFAHEAPMSPYLQQPQRVYPGVLENVPDEFKGGREEPAFRMEETTFCIWRKYSDNVWQHGPVDFPAGDDPDGSKYLLSPLDGLPETYKRWAEAYYERPVDLGVVAAIYKHVPLDQNLVTALNLDMELEVLQEDVEEIGYPASLEE